jgi:molybdopterin converting factor small subunit
MSVTVRIPTQLRELTSGEGEITVEAATVREAIDQLDAAHPGIGERLLDDSGNCDASSTSSWPTRTSASSKVSTLPPLVRRFRSCRPSPAADFSGSARIPRFANSRRIVICY